MGLRFVSVQKELYFFQTLLSLSNLTDCYEFDTNRFPIREYLKHPRTPQFLSSNPLTQILLVLEVLALKRSTIYLLFPLYILFMVDVTVPCSSARDTFHINY